MEAAVEEGRWARVSRCPARIELSASVLSRNFATLICHPDRSEAEWRDLVFSMPSAIA